MFDIQEVLTRFNGVKQTGKQQWIVKCPCHDDKKQSLSISIGTDGRILLFDQAGCDKKNILSSVGLSFADITPVREAEQKINPKIVATYLYSNGTRKLRYEPKGFSWQHYNPVKKSWEKGQGENIKNVLYKAGNASNTAYVCEGEKDADNLSKLGYWCVSGEMGANKWFPAYNEELQGCNVVILPDNDIPGKRFANMVASALRNVSPSVKVLDLVNISSSKSRPSAIQSTSSAQ